MSGVFKGVKAFLAGDDLDAVKHELVDGGGQVLSPSSFPLSLVFLSLEIAGLLRIWTTVWVIHDPDLRPAASSWPFTLTLCV